jgi:hypothetical protein
MTYTEEDIDRFFEVADILDDSRNRALIYSRALESKGKTGHDAKIGWEPHDVVNEVLSLHRTMADLLTSRFGPQVGLNADWCVSAWKVSDDLFWLDQEDGNWELVRAVINVELDDVLESLSICTKAEMLESFGCGQDPCRKCIEGVLINGICPNCFNKR